MKQVWLGICLCALLIAVATQQGNKREHRSKWGNNKKRDQISILKCQDVVCQDGKFCYNGICKKVDYRCIGKKCEKGFRCNKGECVEQRHKPKKQLCEPLGFDKQRLRCGERQKDRCLGSEVRPRVCGFTWGGVFQEFENQCSACLTHRFKYYFESSCSEAPKICSDQEQCLNGLCSLILDEQVYENQRSCNENEECKANQQCAGHKCIKKVELLAYLKTAFEAAPILQNA